jgi:exodeoxyribonuclease VII large subunit
MYSQMTKRLASSRRHLQMLSDSSAMKGPEAAITIRRNNLNHLFHRLTAAQERITGRKRTQFSAYTGKLDALSPLKVLSRGYSITQTESGTVLHSVRQTSCGETVQITLADGSLSTRVEKIKENENG